MMSRHSLSWILMRFFPSLAPSRLRWNQVRTRCKSISCEVERWSLRSSSSGGGEPGATSSSAAKVTDPQSRVLWFGPPMGARSFLSARIMETWAHGQDIADTFGVQRAPDAGVSATSRISVSTRAPFSYVIRGMEPRSEPVRVELLSSEEDTWDWGPEECPASVVGGALDFCLVVTRRRHVSDTNLVVTGEPAQEWMGIAQSFAGPPGPQRSSG